MKQKLKIIGDIVTQIFIITGFLYAAFELLVVFHVPGQPVILFGQAAQIDWNILFVRRLYAIEFWIIFFGYLFYLRSRKKIWNFQL